MTSLAKWLNVRLRPEWLWVWIPLQSQTMMLLQKVFHGTYFLEKYSKFFQQIFLRTAAYSCFWNVVLPTLCSPWAHNIPPCKIITKFSKVPMSFVKRTEWFFVVESYQYIRYIYGNVKDTLLVHLLVSVNIYLKVINRLSIIFLPSGFFFHGHTRFTEHYEKGENHPYSFQPFPPANEHWHICLHSICASELFIFVFSNRLRFICIWEVALTER